MIKRIVFIVILSFTSIHTINAYAQDSKPAKGKKSDKKKDKKDDDVVIMDFNTPDDGKSDSPFPDVVSKGKI